MASKTPKRVGILVGWEDTFPKAFIEAVNTKGKGEVVAEMAQVHAPKMGEKVPYDVLVDRISHEIEVYKPYLKNAVIQGTYVINDPFWWIADDKFFDNSVVERLGVAVPKTVVLPANTPKSTTRPESHRNMCLTDWNDIFNYVGFPAFLKPYDGGGWKHVYKVNSPEEFFFHYNQTGEIIMVLQEGIEFEEYVRCLCIGKENVMPCKYDPKQRCYLPNDDLDPKVRERVIRDSKTICEALGYDMNSCEFAVRDGIPYAIDFMNPAPDMDYYSITPRYFEWAVDAMSDFAIKVAKEGRTFGDHYPWMRMLRAQAATEAPAKAKGSKEPAFTAEEPAVTAAVEAKVPAKAAPAKKAPAKAKK